jgi:predicted metal-dependent phosphotriesterase family hydrolase/predicted ATPase
VVTVPTSAGEADVESLGVVLMHEHVFVRTEALQWSWPGFGGWDEATEVATARERLTRLKRAGVDAIVDMTVPGLGRDPALVVRAAAGTGVRVLFATGFYAPDGLPAPFQVRGPGRLLDGDDRMLESLFEQDVTTGMTGTGIRAAVLGLITDARGMTGDAERLARAVASVSARTGTVICSQAHAPTRQGLEQQRIFAEHGVDPGRVLIGHCSESTDLDYLEALIGGGCYIGWDGCGQSMDVPLDTQLDTLAELCWRGHAGRVMVAHDQASFTDYWREAEISRALPGLERASVHGGILPGLRDRGVPDSDIEQILIGNPRDFLARTGTELRAATAPPRPAARPRVLLTPRPAEQAAGPGPGHSAAGHSAAGDSAAGHSAAGHPAAGHPAAGLRAAGHLVVGHGDCIGREDELAELRGLAAERRMLMLRGAGGTGKTRLLRALTASLADACPDGTSLVSLGDLSHPELVPVRMAEALGVSEEPGIPLADTLTAALAGQRLLAVDGGEQVRRAVAALCARLLASLPDLLIVAAGREPLQVPGETLWQVPPLGLPEPGTTDPARAARSPAVRLLASRAGGDRAGFALDAGNCAAVVAICRAVDGVPLAIELAAARLRDLDAARVAASLGAWPGLPGPGQHAIPVPHQPMVAAAVAWSHSQLIPAEQVLLRRLSLFDGWSLEMAERVCADERLAAGRVASLLAGLVDKALAEPEPDVPGLARYRLPGAVRDFAAARLAAAGESEAVGRRLRDYASQRAEYLMSIAMAKVPVTWPVLWKLFRGYAGDTRLIRAALAWCLEHGETAEGLRIGTSARVFWIMTGTVGEGAWWFDAFLDAAGTQVPAAVRGPALVSRAQLAFDHGDLTGGQARGAAGLELCRTAGDPYCTATALNLLAQVGLAAGRLQETLRCASEALDLARLIGDAWNQLYALANRAGALAAVGNLREARATAQAALDVAEQTDQHWGAALVRRGLGDLCRALGDTGGARDYYLAALPFARQGMPPLEAARCLAHLGRIALCQDDPGQAREYLSESLRLSLAAGGRRYIARGLLAFADLSALEGDPGRAVQLAAAAVALGEAARLPVTRPDRVQRYLDAAAGLGAAEVARLWAAGLELTSRAAARLALGPPAKTAPGTGTRPPDPDRGAAS